MNQTKPIILFDGVCSFCNGTVSFIIRRDTHKRFVFAALQSDVGQKILGEFKGVTAKVDSIVLIEQGQCYLRSTAALRIAKQLKGLWPLLYAGIIIPWPVRDYLYDAFAKRRYRWFGKRGQCLIPTADIKERFLA